MRKFFQIFAVIVLFFLFLQTGLTSCTKTNTVTKTVTDTLTIIEKDTITIKDTALTLTILTANSWKVQEVRALIGNGPIFYLRGGLSNTLSFDNEYITFNADHSGLYMDNSGVQTTFTWNFTDATNTTVVWVWNLPQPTNVTWEHIYYKNGALHYDEYYAVSGQNILTAEIRIPK